MKNWHVVTDSFDPPRPVIRICEGDASRTVVSLRHLGASTDAAAIVEAANQFAERTDDAAYNDLLTSYVKMAAALCRSHSHLETVVQMARSQPSARRWFVSGTIDEVNRRIGKIAEAGLELEPQPLAPPRVRKALTLL